MLKEAGVLRTVAPGSSKACGSILSKPGPDGVLSGFFEYAGTRMSIEVKISMGKASFTYSFLLNMDVGINLGIFNIIRNNVSELFFVYSRALSSKTSTQSRS